MRNLFQHSALVAVGIGLALWASALVMTQDARLALHYTSIAQVAIVPLSVYWANRSMSRRTAALGVSRWWAEYEEAVAHRLASISGAETLEDVARMQYLFDPYLLGNDVKLLSVRVSATQDETKTRTAAVRYVGTSLSYSIRIAPGLRFRTSTGQVVPQRETISYTDRKDLGTGTLTITSKRIVFDPDATTKDSRVFQKGRILKVEAVGIDQILLTAQGKPVLFRVDVQPDPAYDARVLVAIAQKVLSL